jgi:hypothetical protein
MELMSMMISLMELMSMTMVSKYFCIGCLRVERRDARE